MTDIFYEVIRDYMHNVYSNIGVNEALLHFHQQVEILYVIDGEVEVSINDETKVLTNGQVSIADSYDNHKYVNHGNTISHCVIIPSLFLKKYFSIISGKTLKDHFIVDPKVTNKIHEWMSNVNDAIDQNELLLDGSIEVLLGTIVNNNLVDNLNHKNSTLIKEILVYIEENYQNQISLDNLSHKFGYSKYYFSHIFNKCFHCNLNDYINLVRTRHAISFVLDDHIAVSDAAFTAGFTSMRTFYRTFQRFFNMTPKDYFQAYKK